MRKLLIVIINFLEKTGLKFEPCLETTLTRQTLFKIKEV